MQDRSLAGVPQAGEASAQVPVAGGQGQRGAESVHGLKLKLEVSFHVNLQKAIDPDARRRAGVRSSTVRHPENRWNSASIERVFPPPKSRGWCGAAAGAPRRTAALARPPPVHPPATETGPPDTLRMVPVPTTDVRWTDAPAGRTSRGRVPG